MPDRINRRPRSGGERNGGGDKEEGFEGSSRRPGKGSQSPASPGGDGYLQRIHDVRHLLSGEWVWDVLVALTEGPLQYTILLDFIRSKVTRTGWPGRRHQYLQDGTLNRTLRRLEQGELVRHNRKAAFPYHSVYELTPAALELLAVVVPVVEWAESNAELLERARQRRRAEDDRDG